VDFGVNHSLLFSIFGDVAYLQQWVLEAQMLNFSLEKDKYVESKQAVYM